MNTKKANYAKELSEKDIPVIEQETKFCEIFGCSRATFYNYRKRLNLREREPQRESKIPSPKKDLCYFCFSETQIIHHINMDRNNNEQSNLLPLCYGCHQKLHRIYESLKKLGLKV